MFQAISRPPRRGTARIAVKKDSEPKRNRSVSIPDADPPPTKRQREVESRKECLAGNQRAMYPEGLAGGKDTERGTKRQKIQVESGRAEDEGLKSPVFRDLEEPSRCSILPDDVTTFAESMHSERHQQVPSKDQQISYSNGLTTPAQDVQSSSEGPFADEPSPINSLRTANLQPNQVPHMSFTSAGSTLQESVPTTLPSLPATSIVTSMLPKAMTNPLPQSCIREPIVPEHTSPRETLTSSGIKPMLVEPTSPIASSTSPTAMTISIPLPSHPEATVLEHASPREPLPSSSTEPTLAERASPPVSTKALHSSSIVDNTSAKNILCSDKPLQPTQDSEGQRMTPTSASSSPQLPLPAAAPQPAKAELRDQGTQTPFLVRHIVRKGPVPPLVTSSYGVVKQTIRNAEHDLALAKERLQCKVALRLALDRGIRDLKQEMEARGEV